MPAERVMALLFSGIPPRVADLWCSRRKGRAYPSASSGTGAHQRKSCRRHTAACAAGTRLKCQ